MTMDDLSQRVRAFLDAYAGDAPVPESVVEIVGDLENARRKLFDCLERLVDYQNGCPLPSYEKKWTRAMTDAAILLGRRASSAGENGGRD